MHSANTKHLYNICTMLDQRRRCWADVVQNVIQMFVFAGQVEAARRKIMKPVWNFKCKTHQTRTKRKRESKYTGEVSTRAGTKCDGNSTRNSRTFFAFVLVCLGNITGIQYCGKPPWYLDRKMEFHRRHANYLTPINALEIHFNWSIIYWLFMTPLSWFWNILSLI